MAASSLDFIAQNVDSRPLYATRQLPGLHKIGCRNYLVFKGLVRLDQIRR